jgi:DNA-binding NtrC family response regulator
LHDLPILLVEDDSIMGESISHRLQLERYGVEWVRDLRAARHALQQRLYPLVLSDIRLPDGDGEQLLATMVERYGGCCPPVVFMTGFGSVDQAVRLVRGGAWDYVQKPFDLDTLMLRLREWIPPGEAHDAAWFGISDAAQALEQLITRVADLELPVLIQGESGSGKERVAQRIHADMQAKTRERIPYVAINCAALSESLLESELFGHEAGAFTGATRRHAGVFEQAHGGVLLLDEIGDMPLGAQVKLLRVLQDGQVRRVGGEKALQVQLRLICATHKPLDRLVAAGLFREDLYYRISGLPIHLPPLRDRADDTVWLAHRRVDELNARTASSKRLDPGFASWARLQPWHGNVRELFAAVDRAYHLSADCWVRRERADLPYTESSRLGREARLPRAEPLDRYLARVERDYLEQCVSDNDGGITRTATALGISRKTLWEKLRRYRGEPQRR